MAGRLREIKWWPMVGGLIGLLNGLSFVRRGIVNEYGHYDNNLLTTLWGCAVIYASIEAIRYACTGQPPTWWRS